MGRYLLLFFLFCGGLVWAADTISPEARAIAEKLREMAPTSTSDGSIRVAGPSLGTLDRMTLLRFVDDVRGQLERLLSTSFRGTYYGILIQAEASEASDAPLLEQHLLPPSLEGPSVYVQPTIRILVRDIQQIEPRDLACAICDGLICMKVVEVSRGRRPIQKPPQWFSDGLGHYLETAIRQADAEGVMEQWWRGELPPFGKLCALHSPYASADRRVAAQLVAYWLDFPERGARFEQLCEALVSTEPWSVDIMRKTASGAATLERADRDFDRWILERQNSVLTPGVTLKSHVLHVWRSICLYPGEDAVPLTDAPVGSPEQLIALFERGESEIPRWVSDCARAKIQRLVVQSPGRVASFQGMINAWVQFFDAVVRSEKPAALRAAYATAWEKLKACEEGGLLEDLKAEATAERPAP